MMSDVACMSRPDQVVRTAVECEDLSFGYGDSNMASPVISGLDLLVEAERVLCILGASGCGKTSLLNLIAGFVSPWSGSITAYGTSVTGPGPDRGIVFQDYSLFPWLTALGNVEFGLALRGLRRAERKEFALAQLARVGLRDKAGLYPFELSGGMKQRVAIARTLATSPRVLLMDEPFAALDDLTRSSLQEELLSIHRATRTTIIFVTHNIAEAIALADRAIVLGGGGAIVDDVEIGRPLRSSRVFGEVYERLALALNVRRAE